MIGDLINLAKKGRSDDVLVEVIGTLANLYDPKDSW